MKNEEKNGLFLQIDGVGELRNSYHDFISELDETSGHSILFYGSTGCGKKFLSNECMKLADNQMENIYCIDLIDAFSASNYSSEKKLQKLLEIVEYDLLHLKNYVFEELEGKSEHYELFKHLLSSKLKEQKLILLIRFPIIETFEEFEKYISYLTNDYIIAYFITEKQIIVNECENRYEDSLKFFRCGHLKEGDGKLVIDNMFSEKDSPVFNTDEIELLMSERPDNNKMTIKQLMCICSDTYEYAMDKNIKKIDYRTIALAMASKARL